MRTGRAAGLVQKMLTNSVFVSLYGCIRMKKTWGLGLLLCGLMGAAAARADVVMQLGSFRDVGLAQQQLITATLLGVDVRLEPLAQDGDTLYRVRSEKMPQSDAERLAERLREAQVPVLIIAE